MDRILRNWAVSAGVLMGVAAVLGKGTTTGSGIEILVDGRGRVGLTHFRLAGWSRLSLSLIAGVFFGRWLSDLPSPLDSAIPSQVLALLGIATGPAVAAAVTKSRMHEELARACTPHAAATSRR